MIWLVIKYNPFKQHVYYTFCLSEQESTRLKIEALENEDVMAEKFVFIPKNTSLDQIESNVDQIYSWLKSCGLTTKIIKSSIMQITVKICEIVAQKTNFGD